MIRRARRAVSCFSKPREGEGKDAKNRSKLNTRPGFILYLISYVHILTTLSGVPCPGHRK
jgi:hypothetical protein